MVDKNYNELSKEYDRLFQFNIQEFITSFNNQRKQVKTYNVFYPSFGVKKDEPCNFLIYGQASNRWPIEFLTDMSPDKQQLSDLLIKCKAYSNEFYKDSIQQHNPLDWINVNWSNSLYAKSIAILNDKFFYPQTMKYRAFSSFFWNVIYKTINDYHKVDRNSWLWSSDMVWSNLYKIAPSNGNPSSSEKSFQVELSVQLVKKEIEEINPKYCIVITNNKWWQPFQEALKPDVWAMDGLTEIESVQKYKNSFIIITTRPFKSGSEKHVSQLLKVLNTLK